MKKYFFVLVVVIFASLFSCKQSVSADKTDVSAEQGVELQIENGNFIFKITKDGTASVVGISEAGKDQSDLDIPSKIVVQALYSEMLVSKDDGDEVIVTSIGEGAFEDNVVLSSIHIPSTVTVIEGSAFKGCEKLANVNIPDGVVQINGGTFEGCSSLENISLGNVSNCDPSAFSNCANLKEIAAVESVAETLAEYFEGEESEVQIFKINASDYFRFSNLYDHIRIDGLTEQGKQLESVEIPSEIDGVRVTDMYYNIFSGSRVKILTIPNSFTTIPVYSCEYCDTLEEVYIPSSVKYIETYAFRGNKALKKVVMEEGVETIDTYAFLNCSSLRDVELPYSVKNSLLYAFLGCPLESMVISDDTNFDTWGIDASKVSYKPSKYLYEETENGVVIKGVNREAFKTTEGEFIFPDKVKNMNVIEIADLADFSACGFTSITFPSSIKKIGANAFADCASLSKVTLSAFTVVADSAFSSDVEIVRLGGSSGKGSISSQDSIFEMNINHRMVLIESIKHDYIRSLFEDGEKDLFEIYIPYEVDGIPVEDVFIDQIIHQLSNELRFSSRRFNRFDNNNTDENQFCCIIYLPADKGMNCTVRESTIERATRTIAEEDVPVMLYMYYCPELDNGGRWNR